MARPSVDTLLHGINKVESTLKGIDSVDTAISSAKNVVNLAKDIQATTQALVTDAKALLNGKLTGAGALAKFLNNTSLFASAKENVLHQYRTYNYIFTLSCLSMDELNDPTGTYRSNPPRNVICRNGGGTLNKVKTAYEGKGHVEYFIDNVELTNTMTNTSGVGTTSAHSIFFDVTEPYSMGLFLQTLHLAALQAGYTNYLEAPFLLTLEFVGNVDDGSMRQIPGTKRYIPIKLYEAKMNVTEAGTRYGVRANPYNHIATTDQVNKSNQSISFTGETVYETLQKGDNSLQAALNKRFRTIREQQPNAVVDEFFIVMPKDLAASSTTGAKGKSDKEAPSALNAASASPTELLGTLKNAAEVASQAAGQVTQNLQSWGTQAPALGKIFNDLGSINEIAGAALDTVSAIESLTSSNSSVLSKAINKLSGAPAPKSLGEAKKKKAEGTAAVKESQASASESLLGGVKTTREGEYGNLVQEESTLNDIGKSKMGFDVTSAGAGPSKKANEVYNKETKTMSRAQVTIDPAKREFKFPAGTKITDMIEEVILNSEWGKKFQDRKDDQGMIDWFQIDPQVFLNPGKNDGNQGTVGKVYVYRVVPMKVHSSIFKKPGAKGFGYNKIAPLVRRKYDYIYTGLNRDILDFNIEYNMAFVNSIPADVGNNADVPSTMKTPTDIPAAEQAQGKVSTDAQQAVPTVPQVKLNVKPGGVVGNETTDVRIARTFQNQLVNSNADLVEVDLRITGDPYFLSDSGMGNYTADLGPVPTESGDGSADYQRTEIDVMLNFRTPLDIGGNGGYMEMLSDTVPIAPFSGLYKVVEVKSTFSEGEFNQELHIVRRLDQDADLSKSTATKDTDMVTKTVQPNKDVVPTTNEAAQAKPKSSAAPATTPARETEGSVSGSNDDIDGA
jgi:hypothetical protein